MGYKIFIFNLLLVVLAAKQGLAQKVNVTYEEGHRNIKSEKIVGMISRLPEVRDYISANKNHTLFIRLEDSPNTANEERYDISVGIDQPDRLFTFWHFYVDPKTMQIYFFDMLDFRDGSVIKLEAWRKWRGDPRFIKPHYFKNGRLVLDME